MEKKLIFFLIPFVLFWHWFEPAAEKNQRGIKAYEEKKFDEALKSFLSAKGLKPESTQLKNNTASALYQLKKYQAALEEFSKINPENVSLSKSDFYYNLGNTYFRLNQFQKALESYKKSLLNRPDDMDAKKNYELTLRKKKEQQDQNQQQQRQQNQPQEQEKQKDFQNLFNYLDQNEKKQMKKRKPRIGIVKKEKDW